MLLFVYVDDVLVTRRSTDLIAYTKSDPKTRFDMTDSGKCAFVLGIKLVDEPDESVTMCQRRYVNDILKRFAPWMSASLCQLQWISAQDWFQVTLRPKSMRHFVNLLVLLRT